MNQTNSQIQTSDQQQYDIITPLLFHPNNNISYNIVSYLLNNKQSNVQFNENEYIFYYQQEHNNRFYQITCEIVSSSLITNCLNESFHGVELQQNLLQENLVFTKEDLEFHLTRYLSQYLIDK
ncbi:hypothetical protein RhiirA4_488649 [Rhizophagus irregularis]|uniref:Uncharacterized protein n=1 Tax=Rhizophagus irregularis TaxID=588596 RepID=A0A2I1HTX8_9GLOM|nr:hypothetical protein RhiirA4_488649 [Rhizophagus irregularis]